MLANKLLSIGIFSFLMGIQSSALAAKISGSFDFQGRSKYYAWNYRSPFEPDATKHCPDDPDPTKAKNLTDVTVSFMIHKIKQGDNFILDPKKKSTAKFKQTKTNCPNPEAISFNGQTYTVKITKATFDEKEKWKLKRIDFSGNVDRRTIGPGEDPHDMVNNPPRTVTVKDGILSGFFDFMNMMAEAKVIYTDITDPKNPKPYESDNIMFTKTPKIGDVKIKHIKQENQRDPQQNHQGNSKEENRSEMNFNPTIDQLSFSNTTIDTVFLNENVPSLNDPIIGGDIIIGDSDFLLVDPENEGWFFEDTTYDIQVGNETVLTANLVNPFLFNKESVVPSEIHGLTEDLIFDSEFQAVMDNIIINNTINSPYLDDLQQNLNNGKQRFVSVFSNIVTETDGLTTSGTSETIVWDDGKKVPEPSSILSLLVLSTLGTVLTFKTKLNHPRKDKTQIS